MVKLLLGPMELKRLKCRPVLSCVSNLLRSSERNSSLAAKAVLVSCEQVTSFSKGSKTFRKIEDS